MSTTDRYKLVPYNGNNLPCDNCPIEYICDVYNQYVIYNEIAGDNDLLNKCLEWANDKKTHRIPQLIDDGENTSKDSDS